MSWTTSWLWARTYLLLPVQPVLLAWSAFVPPSTHSNPLSAISQSLNWCRHPVVQPPGRTVTILLSTLSLCTWQNCWGVQLNLVLWHPGQSVGHQSRGCLEDGLKKNYHELPCTGAAGNRHPLHPNGNNPLRAGPDCHVANVFHCSQKIDCQPAVDHADRRPLCSHRSEANFPLLPTFPRFLPMKQKCLI